MSVVIKTQVMKYRNPDGSYSDFNAVAHPPDYTSIVSSIPDGGVVSEDGLLTIKHGDTVLFSVQLPLYGGETE